MTFNGQIIIIIIIIIIIVLTSVIPCFGCQPHRLDGSHECNSSTKPYPLSCLSSTHPFSCHLRHTHAKSFFLCPYPPFSPLSDSCTQTPSPPSLLAPHSQTTLTYSFSLPLPHPQYPNALSISHSGFYP